MKLDWIFSDTSSGAWRAKGSDSPNIKAVKLLSTVLFIKLGETLGFTPPQIEDLVSDSLLQLMNYYFFPLAENLTCDKVIEDSMR